MVVVEEWREDDEQTALDLSQADLPVVVIDARSLRSLQRLGAASPLADAKVLLDVSAADTPKDNPLVIAARQKLHAADLLLAQNCHAGVLDLLASALLNKAAAACGANQPPSLDSAAVWLYGDCVPKQLISMDHAGLIVRVVALSQSPSVPEVLVEQAATDARWLFEALV